MTPSRTRWIDERLRRLPAGAWRKAHLDFHTGAAIARVGHEFDADEFVATLRDAHVDSVVVFAKDWHGHCYYPSAEGPVHPALVEPDLLGKQVAACRAAGIAVSAYICVASDDALAERHPEYLVVRRDRSTYLPPVGQPPGWSALCLSHPELVDRVVRHTTEVLEHCEVDGMWYDMVFPIAAECFCARCLRELRAAGEDPLDAAAQRRHKAAMMTAFVRRVTEHVHALRPGTQVDYNTQNVFGLRERAVYLDNIDIEALATGGWGYPYFPVNVRYARTFGLSCYGMTGRFLGTWGDHGGLKHPVQLRTEIAGIVAQGARCDVGDQVPPGARLPRAVYDTIGAAFAEVERVEDHLEGAVPVTEAAIVVDAGPLSTLGPSPVPLPDDNGAAVYGIAKLLTELHIQFDVVDPPAELERYPLLVLPETLRVDAALAARLESYMEQGGAVLAARGAARLDGTDRLWPAALGEARWERSPFKPTFLRPEGELTGDLPRFDYALYGATDRWTVPDGAADVHGRLVDPPFQRSAEHYSSHQYAAAETPTAHAAALDAGRFAAVATAIGSSYFEHGYWVYRDLFAKLLGRLLPEPLVTTSAPLSAEVAVTHQAAGGQRGARWIVHVVNHSPLRHWGGRQVVTHEDPVPLRDVEVALDLAAPVARVYEARGREDLAFERDGERWRTTVPSVEIGAMVVFEEALA